MTEHLGYERHDSAGINTGNSRNGWQSRPLDRQYPIVYLDTIHFKVRKDGKIVTKAVYSALGIDSNEMKDILGFWVGDNESASFWANVSNEFKSRGDENILIVCKDGMSGFSDAIHSFASSTK